MIAHQAMDMRIGSGEQTDALYHARGIGAAIDQVAKKHQMALGGRPGRVIGVDSRQNVIEQIEATMNVADRIDAPPRCHDRHEARRALS